MYIFDSIGVNVVYDCLRWLNEVVGPDMLEVLAVFVALLEAVHVALCHVTCK